MGWEVSGVLMLLMEVWVSGIGVVSLLCCVLVTDWVILGAGGM